LARRIAAGIRGKKKHQVSNADMYAEYDILTKVRVKIDLYSGHMGVRNVEGGGCGFGEWEDTAERNMLLARRSKRIRKSKQAEYGLT